jgi:hypothetical protein
MEVDTVAVAVDGEEVWIAGGKIVSSTDNCFNVNNATEETAAIDDGDEHVDEQWIGEFEFELELDRIAIGSQSSSFRFNIISVGWLNCDMFNML